MKKLLVSILAIAIAIPTIVYAKANASSLPGLSQSNQPVKISSTTFQTATLQFGGALGFHYSPSNVFIHPGDHIVWDGDFTSHPLVSDEGLWPTNSTGTEFEYVFNKPGVYHFHCFFHGPIGMVGSVTVGFFDYLPNILN